MKDNNKSSILDSFERQVIRGNLFTHSTIGRQSERINEIESFLFGVIDLLIEKKFIQKEEITRATEEIRKEMQEKGELAHAGVGIRIDKSDESRKEVPVNCDERIHICKAICCKLNFALSVEEIESGKIKWDLGQPYFIRHEKNGYCAHMDTKNHRCGIYKNRPSVCRKYSCATDKRIWKNFEKMELNNEWLEENLKEQKIHLQGLFMIPEDNTG